MTTLFFIEHANGQLSDQSLKAITATSQIDGDVHGLIVGSNIDSAVANCVLSELISIKVTISLTGTSLVN